MPLPETWPVPVGPTPQDANADGEIEEEPEERKEGNQVDVLHGRQDVI
jgi:hypothetical protein